MVQEEEKTREVSIVKEKDQFAIRIPKNMEEIFDIQKKDKFLWQILETQEGLMLSGSLLKNMEDGEKNTK
ncbi:MAG TPA: hypothetical protein ENH46_05620 [Candidatus Pacearchaeota archaeon]|nr:hypothetical protein [Candidatus Pacearchaeota archaeon]